jgi:hypothetical protein
VRVGYDSNLYNICNRARTQIWIAYFGEMAAYIIIF